MAYDVVPHDSFRAKSLDQLLEETVDATVVVVEARTLNSFMGEEWTGGDADEAAAGRAELLARDLFPGRHVYVRFGHGNADQTLLISPARTTVTYRTGYVDTAEPRGFGDRLLARELIRLAKRAD